MKKVISDETLFAYVDEELDAAGRAEVEAAMAADPALAQRVQQQRSLRTLLGAAYRPVLEEPVPPRLVAAAQPKPKAKVLELASAREKNKPARTEAANDWSWKHVGGMAACLVLGVFAGRSAWFVSATEDITSRGGQLVASGELSRALSTQLAATQAPDAPVRIGVSFQSRDSAFCRSFVLGRGGAGGLACRQGDEWTLRVVSQDAAPPASSGTLRQASSPVPPAVLKAIDEQIAPGGALDAAGEKAAMNQGWRK